jgi:hypothetical protein
LGKLISFRPETEIHILLGTSERADLIHWGSAKGPNWVDVSLPSREEGNWSSFQDVVFSSYLEFRTMDKVNIPSESGAYKFSVKAYLATSKMSLNSCYVYRRPNSAANPNAL